MTTTDNTSSDALLTAIDTALTAEHWRHAELLTPPGTAATAWTGPDRTVYLTITHGPGEPVVADLTGHPAGHTTTAIWSLSITNPAEAQLLAAARAASHHRLREVIGLTDRLQRAGWIAHSDDKPADALTHIGHADSHRTLTRLDGTQHHPGGWILAGDGLQADATDGTPAAVLAALATALRPEREPSPGTATARQALAEFDDEPYTPPDPQ